VAYFDPAPSCMIRAATIDDEVNILLLIDAWPTHFVGAARPLVREDFRTGHTLIYEESGKAFGFLTWKKFSDSVEILWMAVHPQAVRRGIGRSMIAEVEAKATGVRR